MKKIRPPEKKTAKQERSKFSVASILEAMSNILCSHGYAHASTNRIAAEAGVSIGTLYNYFSNREAIALALYEDTSSQASLIMKKALAENIDTPIQESGPILMRELLVTFRERKHILINLIDETPELRDACRPFSFGNLTRSKVNIFLQHADLIHSHSDAEKMVYVLEGAILGNIRRHLLDEQEATMSDEEFIKELSSMIVSYLSGTSLNKQE